MCHKIPYQTRAEATLSARRKNARQAMPGTQRAYRCPHCDLFHLTHLSRSEQRRIERRRRAA